MKTNADSSTLYQAMLALQPYYFEFSISYLEKIATYYPYTQGWFRVAPHIEAQQFAKSLEFLLAHQHHPEELKLHLKYISLKLQKMGVLPEHYELFAQLMMEHLAISFGSLFNDELRQQCFALVTWIATTPSQAEEDHGIYSY